MFDGIITHLRDQYTRIQQSHVKEICSSSPPDRLSRERAPNENLLQNACPRGALLLALSTKHDAASAFQHNAHDLRTPKHEDLYGMRLRIIV